MEPAMESQIHIESTFLQAFAVGLLVLAVFAWDQLNRPSYRSADMQRRARLLELLVPSELRGHAVFLRGYLFYVALLAVLYAIVCFGGATLYALRALVNQPVGGFEPNAATLDFNTPAWPLLVSLMMVGLLPATPVINRVEEKLRHLAHRLVGIPESFFDHADTLSKTDLREDELVPAVISSDEIEKIRHDAREAKAHLGDGPLAQRFHQALLKVHVFRAVVLDADAWPSSSVRGQYRKLEAEVAPATLALIEDLDDLRQREAAGAAAGDAEQRRAAERRWRALAERAAATADDVCALLVLYSEKSREAPRRDDPAEAALRDFFERASAGRRHSRPQFDVLMKVLLVLAGAMFACGYLGNLFGIVSAPGPRGSAPSLERIMTGIIYFVGTLAIYGPATIAAWVVRQGRIDRERWRPAFAADEVFPTSQYLWVFAAGYGVTAVTLSALGFAHYLMAASDFSLLIDNFMRSGIVVEQLQFATLGGAHAVLMAMLFDLQLTRGEARGWQFRALPAAHGAALLLLCFLIAEAHGRPLGSAAFEAFLAGLFGLMASWLTISSLRHMAGRAAAPQLATGRPVVVP